MTLFISKTIQNITTKYICINYLRLIQILISAHHYHQSKKTRHFCPNNCGKSYKFSNTLNRHIQYECGDLRRFHCPCCSKTFKQKSAMQGHAATIHKCLIK